MNNKKECDDEGLSDKVDPTIEFSSLQQIVDELKFSGYGALKENPAFRRLENIAQDEDHTTDPLLLTEVNDIVEQLESSEYENLRGNLRCDPAFEALKKIAKNTSFNPLT